MRKKFTLIKIIVCYSLILLAFAFFVFNTDVSAATKDIELLTCGPGENMANSATFSWHGSSSSSTFYITTADDASFSKAKTYTVTGTMSNAFSGNFVFNDAKVNPNIKDDIKNYYFDFALNDLTANTKYIYKVRCASKYSDVQSFSTSGTNGSYKFLWVGDIHAYDNGSTERYTYLEKLYQLYVTENGIPNLIISTGDDVAYGGSYGSWQTLFNQTHVMKDSIYAVATGNHTEYGAGTSSVLTNRWIEEMMAHPENGTGENLDTCYYYLYNGTLFVALDAMTAHKNNAILRAQKVWFEEVMEKMKGTYQYLIVYQHYPWLNALTGEIKGPYNTNRQVWNDLFDKYQVDLALSGDYHCYYRSKSMIGTEIVEDGVGTTYIGAPQIGGRGRAIESDKDPEYYYKRYDDGTNYAYFSAATSFEVTPQGISGKLVDIKGNVVDEYFIPAKRSVTWEDNKDAILNSVIFSTSKGKNYIDLNRTYADCVKEIKVYNGANLLATLDPNNFNSSIEITGLDANATYELKLDVTFIDSQSKSKTVIASTYPYFGTLGAVKLSVDSSKANLTWKSNFLNDVVNKVEVYADNSLLSSLDSTKTSLEIDKSKVNINTIYTINAVSSKNEVLYSYQFSYDGFGDANFDGTTNKDDVTYLMRQIMKQTQFGSVEYKLLDLNEDEDINIGDVQILLAFYKNKIHNLNNKTCKVLFLDSNGGFMSEEVVTYGANAHYPSVTSVNFVGWSGSNEGITRDTVIKAITN